MLPFPVSNQKLKEVFGQDTQLWGYSGVYKNTLCFDEPVTEMVADTPYLIKPGVGKGEYEFYGEDVDYTDYNLSPSLYLKNNYFYYMPSENTTLGWKAYGGIVNISDGNSEGSGANVSAFDLAVGHSGDASVIESYSLVRFGWCLTANPISPNFQEMKNRQELIVYSWRFWW